MSVTPTLDGKTTAAPSADAHSASPVESPVLRRELLSLEQRLRQFRSSAVTDAREASSRLAELEREFHTLFDRAADPAARPGGAVILAEIHSLAAECRRLGLDDVAEDCALAAQGFLESAARSWRDSRCAIAQAPDPDGCFSSLVETSILELEAELQSAEQSVAAEVFSETRSTLRAAFVDCYENDPPKEDVRERWATELTDRGDLLLTSLDDLPPERAARRLEIVADDIAWHLRHIERRDASAFPPLLRGGSRGGRRRLKRKLSQLRAEQQERRLHSRLENRFGRGLVGASERLVLFLICLVVGLLTVEAFWELSPRTLFWFMAIDTAACAVFLTEFFVKLAHVRGKGGWFRRHFLIDFLPSIPFGLILVALPAGGAADAVRIGRLGRLLRLPLLARYVRVLRPAIRMLRGFGLLARGFDRVVRQYGHILNQNVILYPRRQELQRAQQRRLHDRSDLRRLDGELNECWHALLGAVADADRRTVARSRLEILRDQLGRVPHYESSRTRVHDGHIREIPAAMLIDRLMTTTPQEVEADLGENLLAQLARHVRTFGRWPLRWLPVVRQAVPHITREMSDAELVSAAARRLGALLKRYHDRWFWFADLYGTVTPSQFVDRVGSMLVRSSFRPFYRLVLFGGLFLMTQLAIELTRSSLLNPVQQFLNRFVGPTVMVLGTICFFILVLGWWLKRIAREATEFYERSVEAQFLSLTEIVRGRHLRRDAQIVFDRVIRPEWELTGSRDGQALTEKASRFYNCVRQSLVEAASADEDGAWLRGVETTLLLYRDWLDGGILTDNDTRTTSQLLGSPAVRQFLGNSRRIDRRQIKSLQTLDLVRQKSLFGGPYLWFNFIARSVAHSVANLLVDYNQYVIPLDELPHVSSDVRTAYDRWLAEGDGTAAEPADDLALGVAERDYITTAFTALHFLDFDEARDRQVELRFGPRVLKRLRIDRSLMIRRIFGTYPMHDRPKEQRVVNLYALYRNWIAGGRAFLLPLYAFLAGWKFLWTLLVWVWRAVQQIRRPELRASNRDAARAHFFAAVRKIGRVRGPIVFASMRLRMMLDPEYLGLTLPTLSPPLPKGEPGGITSSPPLPKGGPGGVAGFSTPTTDLESDLAFLDPPPDFLDEVERERNRAAGDMRRLEEALEQGLLRQAAEERGLAPDALSTPEHIRAAAVVWLGDYRGVRSHLAAEAVLAEVSRRAAGQPLLPGRWLPRPRLKRSFRRWWAANGFGEKAAAKAAWRAVLNNVGGSRTALVALDRHGTNVADVGRQMLGEILLHPGRITEQLVTLRAIQTLAVLDVLNYREHIYHLGRYADMGDEPGELLTWATAGCRSAAQAIGFAPDPAAAPSHGAA